MRNLLTSKYSDFNSNPEDYLAFLKLKFMSLSHCERKKPVIDGFIIILEHLRKNLFSLFTLQGKCLNKLVKICQAFYSNESHILRFIEGQPLALKFVLSLTRLSMALIDLPKVLVDVSRREIRVGYKFQAAVYKFIGKFCESKHINYRRRNLEQLQMELQFLEEVSSFAKELKRGAVDDSPKSKAPLADSYVAKPSRYAKKEQKKLNQFKSVP